MWRLEVGVVQVTVPNSAIGEVSTRTMVTGPHALTNHRQATTVVKLRSAKQDAVRSQLKRKRGYMP